MGADIYLNSVYEKQRKALQVDHLENVYEGLNRDPKATEDQKEEARKAWLEAMGKAEDGAYFRDSYNESSLAWLTGLSYWQAAEHCDSETGLLHLNEVKRWRDHLAGCDIPALTRQAIENGKQPMEPIGDDPKKLLAHVSRAKLHLHDETEEDVIKYFTKKKDRFIKLLDRSLELGEGLYWSV